MGLGRTVRDGLINGMLAWTLVPVRVRVRLLSRAGMNITGSAVSARCFFGGTDISIGRGTYISYECFFDNQGSIAIGQNVDVGQRVQFVTSVHETGPTSRRAGPVHGEPIAVGDGTWIGAGALIMPGVTIGTGCIIGAGAVVTKYCAPNGIYVGSPARRISELPND